MSSNLPEAIEVYIAAWLILTKTEISIAEIDLQGTGLGLIGPGNGRLTRLLGFHGLARFDFMHCIIMCLEEFS